MYARFCAPILSLLFTASYPTDSSAQSFPVTELGLEHSHEWLSNGRAPWIETTAQLSHRRSVRGFAQLGVRRVGRFGEIDHDVLSRGSIGLSDRWTASAEAAYGIETSFLPRVSVVGHLRGSFPGGWGGQVGVGTRSYPEVRVTLVHGLAERYWAEFRAAYRLTRASIGNGGSGTGHLLQLHRFHGERSFTAVGLGTGREPESLRPGGVVVLDTRAVNVWGAVPLTNHLDAVYGLGWARHGELFKRRGIRIGIAARF